MTPERLNVSVVDGPRGLLERSEYLAALEASLGVVQASRAGRLLLVRGEAGIEIGRAHV